MKKTYTNAVLVLGSFLLMMLVSCQPTASGYVRNFQRFIEKVEKNASSYSEEDWNQADLQFKSFTGEKYDAIKQQLSADDEKVVGELVARYYKIRVKTAGANAVEWINDKWNFLQGLGNEFLNELGLTNKE